MPLLEELSPAIVGHLNALASQLRENVPSCAVPVGLAQLSLKRSHLEAIQRARRLGQGAQVAIGEGRELIVAPHSGALSIRTAAGERPLIEGVELDAGSK